ncbi:heparinase II/III-family protein [Nitrosomonas sp. H1_AOB3]|uniref:heparinase II/III family protein n=1 Tax=Nitrosomonas sp. H1_AOB3 TaxID=2741553 RepID=UPI001937AA34|nr:heparinase II/III-family protein [Nitrosomonas sp. H1_AOB3]QOJ08258.1 MAG: alginate lyase family protein [Nitrosomonas sp. H1_AOB3]
MYQLVRQLLDNLIGDTRSEIYRPALSERAFNFYISGRCPDILSINKRDAHEFSDFEYASHIALEFRERIGPRFFLHPANVGKLCQQAYQPYSIWSHQLIKFVSEILNDGVCIYGVRGSKLSEEFPWQSVPAGPGGDSLYSIRPHRFAFLPRLALATYQQLIPASHLLSIVESWIKGAESGRNPFFYASNLVVIQRILATTWAWFFLAARPVAWNVEGLGLESRLLRILWADIQFLVPRIGSSAPNNHLLADRFVAYFIQTIIPEFSQQIECGVEEKFRDELLRQTYDDGGSFEHSTHYHEFACEMGIAYLLLCRQQGRTSDEKIRQRVEALLRFQAALTGPNTNPLTLGNATEDTLFPLDSGGGWCSGALREIYRALFDARVAPAPDDDLTIERAFWLLGGNIWEFGRGIEDDSVCQSFPKGGIHVYPDMKLDGRLIFRSGPLCNSSLAAGHAHADLLSIYLSMGEQIVLGDAGTYTYRSLSRKWPKNSPDWRNYFAGPAAHNTLCIEGHDPFGKISGDFRKFDIASPVQCHYSIGPSLAWSEGTLSNVGIYSGYVRGCIHVKGYYWIVYDDPSLLKIDNQLCWYGFQCAPGSRLSTTALKTLRIENNGRNFFMATSLLDFPTIIEGSLNPLGGWVSPSYGSLLSAPQVRYKLKHGNPSAFVITTQSRVVPESVNVSIENDGNLVVLHLKNINGKDLLIVNKNVSSACIYDDLMFDGRLLWVRFEEKQPILLRWIGGRFISWKKYEISLNLEKIMSNTFVL